MNIGLHVLGRLQLYNEVHLGNVEPSCCDVGCDEALEFALLKGFEGDFALLLGDVAVEDLGLLLEVGFEDDFVGLLFGLAEDDGSAVPPAVDVDDVGDDRVPGEVGAVDAQVLHRL